MNYVQTTTKSQKGSCYARTHYNQPTIITVISKAVGGKEDEIRISVFRIYALHCSQDSMNSRMLIALPG